LFRKSSETNGLTHPLCPDTFLMFEDVVKFHILIVESQEPDARRSLPNKARDLTFFSCPFSFVLFLF